MYIRRLEEVQDILLMSCVRSIYVLYLGGMHNNNKNALSHRDGQISQIE